MRKSTWMAQLERALSREGMTGTEKRTVLNYYEEMYQDRFDDGAAEEDIIKEFGFPEDVAQSVREESDERSRRQKARDESEVRGGEQRKERAYNDFDIPVGTYVPPYDVEAQGYNRSAPQYGVPAPCNAPAPAKPPEKSGEGAGIIRTVVYILVALVLLAVGFGLAVGGIAVIVAAFATIAFSAGIWLITFGVGLMLLAIGCLIFGSAIKLFKSALSTAEGGAR